MIVDESVLQLRIPKRMGWILDSAGRSTGHVVVPGSANPFRPHEHDPRRRDVAVSELPVRSASERPPGVPGEIPRPVNGRVRSSPPNSHAM